MSIWRIFIYSGGLGNQLIQFCAHKAISDYFGESIKPSLAWYGASIGTQRSFDLERVFDSSILASVGFSSRLLDAYSSDRTDKVSSGNFASCRKILSRLRYRLYVLLAGSSSETILRKNPSRDYSVIRIYNESWHYSYFLSRVLYETLPCLIKGSETFHTLLAHVKDRTGMLDANTCVVHMRFGDYIANSRYVPLSKSDYYVRALREASRYHDIHRVLIVSDDQKLAFEEVNKWSTELDILVNDDSVDHIDDFALLASSLCLIASNSTFSLCASTLVVDRGGFVILPARWFADKPPLIDVNQIPSDRIHVL